MMENIQELIYKTYSLGEVVPQSVQWALLGLGAFKVAEHFLAVAKGNSARGSLIIICLRTKYSALPILDIEDKPPFSKDVPSRSSKLWELKHSSVQASLSLACKTVVIQKPFLIEVIKSKLKRNVSKCPSVSIVL